MCGLDQNGKTVSLAWLTTMDAKPLLPGPFEIECMNNPEVLRLHFLSDLSPQDQFHEELLGVSSLDATF